MKPFGDLKTGGPIASNQADWANRETEIPFLEPILCALPICVVNLKKITCQSRKCRNGILRSVFQSITSAVGWKKIRNLKLLGLRNSFNFFKTISYSLWSRVSIWQEVSGRETRTIANFTKQKPWKQCKSLWEGFTVMQSPPQNWLLQLIN